MLQHDYNIKKARYEQRAAALQEGDREPLELPANSSLAPASSSATTFDQIAAAEVLKRQVLAAESLLASVGSPFMRFGFAVEIAYICTLVIAYFTYVHTQIYSKYNREFNFNLIRAITDPLREKRQNYELILKETDNLIVSNRNFTNEFTKKALNHFPFDDLMNVRQPIIRDCINELLDNHKRFKERLRELLHQGKFKPLNRRTECVGQLISMYTSLIITILVVCIGFIITILFIFPAVYFGSFLPLLKPINLIFVLELIIYSVIITISTTFYLTLIGINGLDQVEYIIELRKTISECCSKSTITTYDQGRFQDSLVCIIMHYKILVTQISSNRKSSSFLAEVDSVLSITVPVVGRIYSLYLNQDCRSMLAICSIFFVLMGDVYLVRRCKLYSRCLNLYKALSGLLARAIELSLSSDYVTYDSFLLGCLKRELCNLDRFTSRLAITAFGLPVTYSNLVRLHFWLGLLIISNAIANIDKYVKERNSFIFDPFGLYRN